MPRSIVQGCASPPDVTQIRVKGAMSQRRLCTVTWPSSPTRHRGPASGVCGLRRRAPQVSGRAVRHDGGRPSRDQQPLTAEQGRCTPPRPMPPFLLTPNAEPSGCDSRLCHRRLTNGTGAGGPDRGLDPAGGGPGAAAEQVEGEPVGVRSVADVLRGRGPVPGERRGDPGAVGGGRYGRVGILEDPYPRSRSRAAGPLTGG